MRSMASIKHIINLCHFYCKLEDERVSRIIWWSYMISSTRVHVSQKKYTIFMRHETIRIIIIFGKTSHHNFRRINDKEKMKRWKDKIFLFVELIQQWKIELRSSISVLVSWCLCRINKYILKRVHNAFIHTDYLVQNWKFNNNTLLILWPRCNGMRHDMMRWYAIRSIG